MRYRLMATYRGVPYEAGVGPTDKDVVLFAACPPPEELGFQPAPGHWRKSVRRAEVDAVWESRPSGTFRGEPCLVLDDLGERLHISYPGHDPARAARLGYSQMEPGVFELLAAREEVTEITEDRVDHPFLPWHEPAAESRPWHEPAAEGGAALAHRGPDPGPGADARHTEPFPSVDARHGEPWAAAWPGADARDTEAGPGAWPGPAGRHREPEAGLPAAPGTGLTADPAAGLTAGPAPGRRQHRVARRPPRAQTRQIFAELAGLAALPADSYAVDEAVDGAICLVSTDTGFEVFSAADGVKREARLFHDEEAAYFYLFGLLAAEAVRDGRLGPPSR